MAVPNNYIQMKEFTSEKTTSKGVKFTHTLRVYEISYSVENNSSRVFMHSILEQTYTGTMFSQWGTGAKASIDNVQRYYNYTQRELSGTSEHTYDEWSWEGDIPHNADGSKTIRLDADIWQESPTYFVSGGLPITNKSMTLTTIPRASSIASVSGSALDSAVTVNITRASSSFTHKVEYDFNGSGWIVASNNAGTSCAFTPKASDLARYIPTTDKGTLTVRVTTFSGSNQIGSPVTQTATLYLPNNYQPSLELGYALSNPSAIREWGIAVKGFTSIILEIVGATASIGSEIASYSISGGGYSSNSSTLSTGAVNIYGGFTFTARVTDKRGRTATDTVDIYIENYFTPTITLQAYRCRSDGTADSNGTYLYITSSFNYAKIGKNRVNYAVNCNGASNTSFESGKSFILNANCHIGSTYVVTATISDVLSSVPPVTASIPTAIRPITIKANGKSVAIGKVAEKDNTLEIAWDVGIDGALAVANGIWAPDIPKAGTMAIGFDRLGTERNFMGSILEGTKWYNAISVRHRNGLEDGNINGMFIRARMEDPNSSLTWNQQANGTWGYDRTIIDSVNYYDYAFDKQKVEINSSTNLNDCISLSTMYHWNTNHTPANAPSSGCSMHVVRTSWGYLQVAIHYHQNTTIWIRNCFVDTWGAWKKVSLT